MASAPVTPGNAPTYRPLFKRVGQNELNDTYSVDFMGEFACIATICGVTLEDIRNIAIKKHHHPQHGPFEITEMLIQSLLAANGWKATEWKDVLTPLAGLPDIAILWIDYNEELDLVGRPVVYQRAASKESPRGFIEHILDPAYWLPKDKQVTNDCKAYAPTWYMGIYPMPYPTSGIPKAPPAPVGKK